MTELVALLRAGRLSCGPQDEVMLHYPLETLITLVVGAGAGHHPSVQR